MHRFIQFSAAAALTAGALTTSPTLAEVAEVHDDHFITRNEAVVDASRTETWLALISPARWWSSEHTWSADAENLRLTPQAGGCFCETIPETETPDGGFTLQGSVEHMRVIQAYPEAALRMSGALGPLQSEPVSGILTIAISEAEESPEGKPRTRIVWEYNVGGKMRYPIPVISNAVDGVMTLQLTRLADLLGVVVAPSTSASPAAEEPGPEEGAPAQGDPEGGAEAEAETAPIEDEEPKIAVEGLEGEEADAAEEPETPDGPSVDEAFDDLSDGT